MYNLSAYYISKMAADLPAEILNTVLFTIITYWFGGLRHTTSAFFGLLFSLILFTAVAESWGLLIGGIFMEAKTAQVRFQQCYIPAVCLHHVLSPQKQGSTMCEPVDIQVVGFFHSSIQ